MKAEEYADKFVEDIQAILDEDFSYEQKRQLLTLLNNYVKSAKKTLRKARIEIDGKCPHENLVDKTTLADPEGIRVKKCMDCGKELTFKEGILQNAENESS